MKRRKSMAPRTLRIGAALILSALLLTGSGLAAVVADDDKPGSVAPNCLAGSTLPEDVIRFLAWQLCQESTEDDNRSSLLAT